MLVTLAEIEAEKQLKEMEWEVFESFLGIVGSSLSIKAIKKFADTVPELFALAKVREYSPELLRNVIIKDLSGGTLEILRCSSCKARFYVDKPSQGFQMRHHCQLCGSSLIETDVTGPEIIKKSLATLSLKVVVTPVTNPKGASQDN